MHALAGELFALVDIFARLAVAHQPVAWLARAFRTVQGAAALVVATAVVGSAVENRLDLDLKT